MVAHDGEFFEVSKKLFTNKVEFDKLSNSVLERNMFMMNRSIAIQYPDKAQAFNLLKINGSDVMKFWADYLGGKWKVPGFMYTKGAKSSKIEKERKNKIPSSSLIRDFCVYNNYNRKDVINAIKMFNEDMISEINEYDKLMKQIEK